MALIMITGASSGIGAAAAVELTRAGHQVVATGRSVDKLRAVHDRMIAEAPSGVRVPDAIPADLSNLNEVRDLATRALSAVDQIDVLVNNAGVQPLTRHVSVDGFELTFAVNHLAPFLLTGLLAERLRASDGRVITTSSSNHAKAELDLSDPQLVRQWSPGLAYANSKLANILFSNEVSGRLGLPSSTFHPGTITTDLNRDSRFASRMKLFERIVMGSPKSGADTLIWLAVSTEGAAPTASYYYHRRPHPVAAAARDTQLAARLWDLSTELTRVSYR